MGRLRTFIAVDVGKAVRDRVGALQQSLARTTAEVKWVEPENLHVTLLFLGEVDERELPAVCRVVADGCRPRAPFTLGVRQVGCFPHSRRPRVLWVGIEAGAAELVALHDALEPPLLELGCYRREDRPFNPHLTFGRVKADRVSPKLTEALAKQSEWHGGDTEVREVLVLSSELRPAGPSYTVLSRAPLADAP